MVEREQPARYLASSTPLARPRVRMEGFLLLLLLLGLVRGLLYMFLVPPWQGPDEPRHFEYARMIADNKRLVTMEDLSLPLQEAIIQSMAAHDFWRFGFAYYGYDANDPPRLLEQVWPGDFAHQIHQPPLYYVGAALAALAMPGDGVVNDLYAMRLYSLILGLIAIIIAARFAADLFPDDTYLRLGIPAFVAFLPMHMFIASVLANDILAEVAVSLLLWRTIRLLKHGFSMARALDVLFWMVLALFTKLTALVSIPIALTGLLLSLIRSNRRLQRRLGRVTLIMAVLILALASMLILSANASDPVLSAPARFLRIPHDVVTYLTAGDYAQAITATPYGRYVGTMFRSFWGLFGWLNVPLPQALYWLLAGLCLLAFAGLVRGWSRQRKRAEAGDWQRTALWLCALSPLYAIFIILAKEVLFLSYLGGGLPHGRYLFPVMIPIATLLLLGWRALLPERHRRHSLAFVLLFLFLLDSITIWGVIRPFYYG